MIGAELRGQFETASLTVMESLLSEAETSSPNPIFLVSATSRLETPSRKLTTALGAVSSSPASSFFVTSPRAKVLNGGVGCSS